MKARKVPQNVRLEITRDIISWQLKGWSFKEISLSVKDKLQSFNVTDDLCNRLVLEANQLMRKENSLDIIHCVDTHTIIYEEIYRWFCEYGDIAGSNRAMALKEKMLGLHKEDRSVVFNNKVKIKEKVEKVYDIDKLNTAEQRRLNELLTKGRKKNGK